MAKRKIKVLKVVSAHIDAISNVSEGDNGVVTTPIWQSKEQKEDGESFQFEAQIIQVDKEKRHVNYVVQEAGVVNYSRRYWTADVLEQCCNQFNIEAGATGTNRLHYEDKATGKVISQPSKALITQNFMLYGQGDPRFPGTKLPAWVQQWYYPPEANDEFKEAKIGKVSQISLQGKGIIEEVEIEVEEEFIKQEKESLEEKIGTIQKILKTIGLGNLQQNIGDEKMDKEQYDNIMSKFDSLLESLKSNKDEMDSKVKEIDENIEQTLQTKTKELKDSLSAELKEEIKNEVNEKSKQIAQNLDTKVSVNNETTDELKAILQKAMGVKVKETK